MGGGEMMTHYSINTRASLSEYIDEASSCGVWQAGPPPPMGEQTIKAYLQALRDQREEAREAIENPCSECSLSRVVRTNAAQKSVELCDYFLTLYHAIPRWHPTRSAKSELERMADIQQACELNLIWTTDDAGNRIPAREECRECPCSTELRVDVGLAPSDLSICRSFDSISPRKDLPWWSSLDDMMNSTAAPVDSPDRSIYDHILRR